MTVGKPAWIDLGTPDLPAATTFYQQLFGWTFTDSGEEYGHYHMVTLGDAPIGGAMDVSGMTCPEGQPIPPMWDVYLEVANADATAGASEEAGATVIMPPTDAGPAGRFAKLLDPSGAAISLWQPGDTPGFEVSGRPGTPVWFELMTQDFDAAVPFYTAVFGLDAQPMSEPMEDASFRYVTHGAQDAAAYGICDAAGVVPAKTGSFWRIYFLVEDTDQALKTIAALGGRLLDGPEDSPFGRLATVADPTGATFQIVSPSQAVPECPVD